MTITTTCPFCGKTTLIEATPEQVFAYMFSDDLVQNIFSDKSATEREMLISGICEECQKGIFGE